MAARLEAGATTEVVAAAAGGARDSLAPRLLRTLGTRLAQLVVFLFVITTLLFFLLRVTGDPATVLAGQNATAQDIARVRVQYGLDKPLVVQYGTFIGKVAHLNFGTSYLNDESAMHLVMSTVGATVLLAVLGMLVNVVVSVGLGCWIGARQRKASGRAASLLVFVAQGIPFYVTGLILIQLFSVYLHVLPSIGDKGVKSWILPSVTLAWLLAPRLTRVVAVNVADALGQEYVRVARATGAGRIAVVLRHALPNALVSAIAFAGTQFAILLSGTLIVEIVFAWPGLGRLLVQSVQSLDFPVVQAGVFVIAGLVFVVNTLTDLVFQIVDPRLRHRGAGR